MYLFDVEYYRAHRQTFTGFGWKFFHLGPWAAEFDPALDELVMKGTLLQRRSITEFETSFYRSAERIDPREPFSNVKDEYILRGVLKLWGARSTGEILDYVYFQTASWNSEHAPRFFCDSTRKTYHVFKIFIRQDQG